MHSECSKVRYYESKINTFNDNKRALGRSYESDWERKSSYEFYRLAVSLRLNMGYVDKINRM